MTKLSNWLIALVIITFVAGGIYILQGSDLVLTFSERDLEKRLGEHLPFTERYMGVVEVSLTNPRVNLVEGSDRIAGGLDAMVDISLGEFSLGGDNAAIAGGIDISGGVRYEPADGALFMVNPQIEKVRIDGMGAAAANRANAAIALALDEYFRTHPIYVLSDNDLGEAATKVALDDIMVKDGKLVLTFGVPELPGVNQR